MRGATDCFGESPVEPWALVKSSFNLEKRVSSFGSSDLFPLLFANRASSLAKTSLLSVQCSCGIVQLWLKLPGLIRKTPDYLDWYWMVISIIFPAGQSVICRLRVARIRIARLS